MQLEIGKRYRFRRINGEILEGTLVQTKGDDDNYPTFDTASGLFGVHRDNVLGPVDDVAPHAGIPRLVPVDGEGEPDGYRHDSKILDMDSTGKHHYYQAAPDLEP